MLCHHLIWCSYQNKHPVILQPAHIAKCTTRIFKLSALDISCYFILLKKVNPYLLHKERLKLTVSQLISAGPGSDTSHLQDPHIGQFDCQTNNNPESRQVFTNTEGYKYLVAWTPSVLNLSQWLMVSEQKGVNIKNRWFSHNLRIHAVVCSNER